MEIILFIAIGFLVFIYAGYGFLITGINRFRKNRAPEISGADELPEVAVVIAAYNEENVIREKIENTLSLNYPADKLKIYLIADGSNDATTSIAASFEQVKLFWQPERCGKTAAINRLMPFIAEPVTIFTDANVFLNKEAILHMVMHYRDPKTGAVSGEKRVIASSELNAAATEGLYWKYESYLKKEDARLRSLAGAAGELFSIRTALYRMMPADTLLDDFMISMEIIRQGYRIAYAPDAYAMETPSLNIAEEYKRKVRIGAGGVQSVLRTLDFLNPFAYGIFTLQYFFHRFSRWIVAPLLIPLVFILNGCIARQNDFLAVLFLLQIVFHAAALLGWWMEQRGKRSKWLFVPFYFDFMHFSVLIGWIRYFSGTQNVTWKKAVRMQTT